MLVKFEESVVLRVDMSRKQSSWGSGESMGWGWGGRTHCRESLEEVHWALKDAGDFTKQKRGLV